MIIIFGPTGTGKTDFASALAAQLPAEIINMDIGSFYTPLSIGTAKPDWSASLVPHHLFDILNSPVNYTVAQYRTDIIRLISDIKSRGKIPILVGGSGFYLKSLFFVPAVASADSASVVSREKTNEQLWHELFVIDPERAMQIHKNDRYRVERALGIWQLTGKKASEQAPEYMPLDSQARIICLTRERSQLYERINNRVDQMMNSGWLEEVKKLRGTDWEQFLYEKKLIGYVELLEYLAGNIELEAALTTIKTKSRNYAKRQLTFWRMLNSSLSSANQHKEAERKIKTEIINLTFADLELYLKQLVRECKAML